MSEKTGLPDSVKLLGRQFAVSTDSSALNSTVQDQLHHWNGTIVLADGLSPDIERAVLLHEILHDISENTGVGLDEQAVTSVAAVLFSVLRDNPELVKYLMGW